MLNAEQREYMIHRVRESRGYTGGKPIFCIDFQNDGEYIDGCIAGGRDVYKRQANRFSSAPMPGRSSLARCIKMEER